MVHDELPFVLIKQPQRFLAVGDGIAVQKLRLIKKSLVSNQLGFVVLGRFQIFDQMHIHYVQNLQPAGFCRFRQVSDF